LRPKLSDFKRKCKKKDKIKIGESVGTEKRKTKKELSNGLTLPSSIEILGLVPGNMPKSRLKDMI
jgi:hypothetical protein